MAIQVLVLFRVAMSLEALQNVTQTAVSWLGWKAQGFIDFSAIAADVEIEKQLYFRLLIP